MDYKPIEEKIYWQAGELPPCEQTPIYQSQPRTLLPKGSPDPSSPSLKTDK